MSIKYLKLKLEESKCFVSLLKKKYDSKNELTGQEANIYLLLEGK